MDTQTDLKRPRPGTQTRKAFDLLRAYPDRRFTSAEVADRIGISATLTASTLNGLARRGLIQSESHSAHPQHWWWTATPPRPAAHYIPEYPLPHIVQLIPAPGWVATYKNTRTSELLEVSLACFALFEDRRPEEIAANDGEPGRYVKGMVPVGGLTVLAGAEEEIASEEEFLGYVLKEIK